MRLHIPILLAACTLLACAVSWASHMPKDSWPSDSRGTSSSGDSSLQNCLPIAEAQKHVGKTYCVSGTVVRVEEGNNGVTFLDFCADYRSCPFTVIVFPGDRKNVGDIRQLQGRQVTIKGRIDEYDERAEIILRHAQQLGDNVKLPALPKDYDVERAGHYSAGTFRATKAKKPKHTTQGAPIPLEDPDEP